MNICIYPGTFDPFTNGHLDIFKRASSIFDVVIVSILHNANKKAFFSIEERFEFITMAAEQEAISNYEIQYFDGLLVDFAKKKQAKSILRGLRAVTDFEYELQMAAINKKLDKTIETLFMMTNTEFSYLSSSIVKEVGKYSGDITGFLPSAYCDQVARALQKAHLN